jgi:hypothetical protein
MQGVLTESCNRITQTPSWSASAVLIEDLRIAAAKLDNLRGQVDAAMACVQQLLGAMTLVQ